MEILFLVWGPQTLQAYFKMGLIIALYTLIDRGQAYLQVSPQKPKHIACFSTHAVDVPVSSDVISNGHGRKYLVEEKVSSFSPWTV